MDESLNSAKEALGKAVDLMKKNAESALWDVETETLLARIQFSLDPLIQNENKIWLRTKKGRDMLGEFDAASRNLIGIIESGSDPHARALVLP